MLIFLWTFVRRLFWAEWPAQEIQKGHAVGSSHGPAWGGEGLSAYVGALIAVAGVGQLRAIPRQCSV